MMILFEECGLIIAIFSSQFLYKISYIHKLVYILRAINKFKANLIIQSPFFNFHIFY
jgi:hypothetical protein